jgi:hypothetical protein
LDSLDRRLNRRCRRSARVYPQPPRAHRLGNILQALRAYIFKGEIYLAANLALRIVRDADAAGLCDPFKPCRNINAVAKDVIVIEDDVTDVNTNAEFDPLQLRHRGILLSHTTLDLDGASGCIDGTSKLDKQTVAGRLNYPSAMRGDGGIDKGLSDDLEPGQHAFFVGTHQAAVSGNIRRQNCRKSSFHAIIGQKRPPEIGRSVRHIKA